METAPPEDEKVAESVEMWLNWNIDKLATMTSYLINFSNKLLNTDSELTEVPDELVVGNDCFKSANAAKAYGSLFPPL